jgi:hypothetical protein
MSERTGGAEREPRPVRHKRDPAITVVVGIVLMFVARFGLRSPFFGIRRESASA